LLQAKPGRIGRLGKVEEELTVLLAPLLLREPVVLAVHAQLLHFQIRLALGLAFRPFLLGGE
jgi:hypothetical protein